MRINVSQKLRAAILSLAMIAAGLSAFSIEVSRRGHDRFDHLEAISELAFTARTLLELVQGVVIDADVVMMAGDREEAGVKLVALKAALHDLDAAEKPFFAVLGDRLRQEQEIALSLRLSEFKAYQRDTANLGLTVSPQSAQIQASDPATVANRERMVQDFSSLSQVLLDGAVKEKADIMTLQREARAMLISSKVF